MNSDEIQKLCEQVEAEYERHPEGGMWFREAALKLARALKEQKR